MCIEMRSTNCHLLGYGVLPISNYSNGYVDIILFLNLPKVLVPPRHITVILARHYQALRRPIRRMLEKN